MISYKEYCDNYEFCRRDQQKSREERQKKNKPSDSCASVHRTLCCWIMLEFEEGLGVGDVCSVFIY